MSVGRLAARAVVGGLFIGHGTQKLFGWFGGPGRAGTAGMMEALQMRPAKVHATLAGVTGYSRVLGKKVSSRTDVPAASGTDPTASTPDDVAAAQRQLKALQWAVPALTGALVVVSAYAGEQQRPTEVHKGVLQRITPGA